MPYDFMRNVSQSLSAGRGREAKRRDLIQTHLVETDLIETDLIKSGQISASQIEHEFKMETDGRVLL
jgi:hypothetical protein